MKYKIIAFGKAKNTEYIGPILEYQKRLGKNLEIIELKHISGSRDEVIAAEEKILSKIIDNKSYNIFLDSRGKNFTSREFAQKLSDLHNDYKEISFFIGGAHGFSKKILNNAKLKLSLGMMTLPHMLARTIILEQIYRAKMIEKNHSYHK